MIINTVAHGVTDVRVTGRARASHAILHPNDWLKVQLTQTSDGIYIFGNPANPAPPRLWGLPVVLFDAGDEGVGYVGDFTRQAAIIARQGVTVQVGMTSDQFVHFQLTIRAHQRMAVVFYRAAAFQKMTGLDGHIQIIKRAAEPVEEEAQGGED